MQRGRFKFIINVTSRRRYAFKINNNIFPSKRKAGGLLLNTQQTGIGQLLWKYFNAPGNVMFVTFNIITFAGLVTFNSLISAQRKQFLEMKFIQAQDSIEKQSHDLMQFPIKEEIDCSPVEVHDEHIVKIETESPIRKYSLNEIELSKKASKSSRYDSQIAKMSLFHMMYAYFLMKYVTSVKTPGSESVLWNEEVKIIQEITSGGDDESKHLGQNKLMKFFYGSWKNEFGNLFDNLQAVQKFHLPDWRYYPDNMRYVCSTLYNNEMNTVDDFAQFYRSVRAKDLKKLLRFWLADHSMLVRPSVGGNNEDFYRTLIKDSYDDDFLFDKYSSILWNPLDSRKRFFFPIYAHKDVRSVSIDTVISVLQGYVYLQEKKGIQHNAEIIRLISMIRKNCVMAKNNSGKGVRILLPLDQNSDPTNYIDYRNHSLKDRQKCYDLVSQNPKVLKLLEKISKWRDSTTT